MDSRAIFKLVIGVYIGIIAHMGLSALLQHGSLRYGLAEIPGDRTRSALSSAETSRRSAGLPPLV